MNNSKKDKQLKFVKFGLKALMKQCRAAGVDLVAAIETAPGNYDTAILIGEPASLSTIFMAAVTATGGNLDDAVHHFEGYCQENGIDTSSSIVLQALHQFRNPPPDTPKLILPHERKLILPV